MDITILCSANTDGHSQRIKAQRGLIFMVPSKWFISLRKEKTIGDLFFHVSNGYIFFCGESCYKNDIKT